MTNELKQFTLTSVKNIQKAIEKNKLIIFVGAGVSINSGIPTWGELVKKLAKDLGIKAKAHDSNGFDYYSGDDYLRIPQYYFNEREEREYIDKVKSVLDKDVPPNEIHDIIFDLNPVHIITTNYDNLIEDEYQVKTTTKCYFKVSNDKELATAPVSNYILKMHGEFENMVLKESDYDSYSSNFKLIETFIKGLFATHTILFVGFSATDSNVRKILQWVRDIVGTKHQPAYLIDVNDHDDISEEEFRIIHDYYKKQGIFTLYKQQINDEIEDVFSSSQEKSNLEGMGRDLYKFLYFIKNYKSFDVDKYYKALCELKSLDVITYEVLGKVFNTQVFERFYTNNYRPLESEQQKYEIDTFRLKTALVNKDNLDLNIIKLLYGNSRLETEQQNLINKYVESPNSTDKDKLKIKQLLSDLESDCKVSDDETIKIKELWDVIHNAQKYEDKIATDECLEADKLQNRKSNTGNVQIFKHSYELYKKHDYINAYRELVGISKNYKYDAIIHYIAEFNKKTVAGNIKWETSIRKRSKSEKEIAQEYDKIDLKKIISLQIPESIKPVIELFTLENIEKKYFKIIELADKIAGYKYVIENSGAGFNKYYKELLHEFHSFFNVMLGNYLFISNYQQTVTLIKQITKALFQSYTTKKSEIPPDIDFGIYKIEKFDPKDLYLIIELLSNEDLEEIIEILKITKLDLFDEENAREYLINKFKNCIDEMQQVSNLDINNIISNYLTVLRLTEPGQDEFKDIINTYISFTNFYIYNSQKIDGHNFRSFLHKRLAVFMEKNTLRYIDEKILFDGNIYEEVIDVYKGIYTLSTGDYTRLITDCITFIAKSSNPKLQKQEIIDFYINENNQFIDKDVIIANFYNLADDIHKKKIKNYFNQSEYKKRIENYFNQSEHKKISKWDCQLINTLIDLKIIRFTKKMENELFSLIDNLIDDKIKSSDKIESRPDPLIIMLRNLYNFAIIGKIKNIDKINEILDKLSSVKYLINSNQYDFDQIVCLLRIYIDPVGYDYSKAKIEDLTCLNQDIIDELKTNINNIKKIAKLLLNSEIDKANKKLQENLAKIFD